MNKKSYFIFGSEAVNLFLEGASAGLVARCVWEKNGDIYCFDHDSDTPEQLLSNYDGWNGFTSITEGEYNDIYKGILELTKKYLEESK